MTLARFLRECDIRPSVWIDGGSAKGYTADDLRDAWDRYVHPSTVREDREVRDGLDATRVMSFAGQGGRPFQDGAASTLHFAFLGVIFAGERGPDLHEVSGPFGSWGSPPWRTKPNQNGGAMRCKHDDCPRRAYTSGWCSTHYRRLAIRPAHGCADQALRAASRAGAAVPSVQPTRTGSS